MTTTQTQQPKALQLADRLKERIRQLNNSWNAKWNRSTEEFDLCAKSEDELRYQHAEIERLHAENETLKLQLLKATTPPMTERAWAEYCLAHRTVDATDQVGEKVRGACNGVAP